MTGHKRVVGRLHGIRETAQSAQSALSLEEIASAGDELVGISLMTDIVDDAVVGGIEDIVQSHDYVDGTHA